MTTPIVSAHGKESAKPSKPRKDFPLFAHASGQWAKKVRGKLRYFGVWDDPAAAEREWERQKPALLDGRDPDAETYGDSIEWLCNSFVESKAMQLERGELSQRAFNDYLRIAKHIAGYFTKSRRLDSLLPNDFDRYRNSLPDTWGPTTINNHLRLARVLFKYANDIGITENVIRYSRGLKSVPLRKLRMHQGEMPAKEFTLEEVHSLLKHAKQPMRAFIMLGINCGYGTADIARLETEQIDLAGSWIGERRGKTGIARGAWLWPETIRELQAAIDQKPFTTNERLAKLAFLTTHRRPWAIDGGTSNPLSLAFGKVKKAAGIEKKGVGHYALRHTLATVAGDSKDQVTVDYIMGHLDASTAATYREGIGQKRIEDVCKFVRKKWLAAKPKGGAK